MCVGILAALLAVGVVIILLLYNIRINHFKFTYGIYMSYGADFRKLFSTSIWEIIAVSTVTFLPAAAASVAENTSVLVDAEDDF